MEWIDKRGRIGARLSALGLALGGNLSAKEVDAAFAALTSLSVAGKAVIGIGPDGFTISDKRGRIGLKLGVDGTLSAPSISGTGSGASKATPTVRRRIASNHGGWRPPATLTVSNGTTQLSGTDRFSWTPNTDVRNVELALLNATVGAAGLLAPVGNALEVVVALEAARSYSLVYPDLGGCSGLPISSGGRSGYFIGDGAMVITRPEHTGVLTKGLTQYYRIHKRVSAGQVWPLNASAGDFTWGGVTTTDAVMGSSIKDGSDQTQAFSQSGWDAFAAPTNLKTIGAFQATAIIAEQVTPTPVVMVVGDSIADGYGGSALGRSYLTRGLDTQGVAWYNCGNPGSNMVALAMNYGPPIILGDFVDHFAIHCGTNDIYGTGAVSPTFSAFQTNFLQYARPISSSMPSSSLARGRSCGSPRLRPARPRRTVGRPMPIRRPSPRSRPVERTRSRRSASRSTTGCVIRRLPARSPISKPTCPTVRRRSAASSTTVHTSRRTATAPLSCSTATDSRRPGLAGIGSSTVLPTMPPLTASIRPMRGRSLCLQPSPPHLHLLFPEEPSWLALTSP